MGSGTHLPQPWVLTTKFIIPYNNPVLDSGDEENKLSLDPINGYYFKDAGR